MSSVNFENTQVKQKKERIAQALKKNLLKRKEQKKIRDIKKEYPVNNKLTIDN